MPYCPKCDMEFIKGVTVCSDCGGPLFESKEEALAVQNTSQPGEPDALPPESFPGRKNRRVPPLPT